MNIYELKQRTNILSQLLEIWEDSVRATHHFLSDAEVNQIKKYVPQALTGVKHLIVAENEIGIPVAFMGTQDHRLEMLFISSKERGKGIGKQLLRYGIENYEIKEVTVNEQNQSHDFMNIWDLRHTKEQTNDEEGIHIRFIHETKVISKEKRL